MIAYNWPKVGQQMNTTTDPVDRDDPSTPLFTLLQSGYPVHEVLGVW